MRTRKTRQIGKKKTKEGKGRKAVAFPLPPARQSMPFIYSRLSHPPTHVFGSIYTEVAGATTTTYAACCSWRGRLKGRKTSNKHRWMHGWHFCCCCCSRCSTLASFPPSSSPPYSFSLISAWFHLSPFLDGFLLFFTVVHITRHHHYLSLPPDYAAHNTRNPAPILCDKRQWWTTEGKKEAGKHRQASKQPAFSMASDGNRAVDECEKRAGKVMCQMAQTQTAKNAILAMPCNAIHK